MTRLEELWERACRCAPIYSCWRREKAAHVAAIEELWTARKELAIVQAHLVIAREQADKALELLMADEWSSTDRTWLDELGVDG